MKARTHGFTLVEVMVAVAIMTVGTVGLLSMHQSALLANRASRMMAQGNTINRNWIQRVQRDAFQWNEAGFSAAELGNTEYVSELVNELDTTGWFKPEPADTTKSWGFNWVGGDTRTAADIRFCTHIRLSWVRFLHSVRVDARTFWVREGIRGSTEASSYSGYCGGGDPDTLDLNTKVNIRAIYASTVVRWIPH